MRFILATLLLGAGLQDDAPAKVATAIDKTRAPRSTTAKFRGEVVPPGGAKFEVKGDLVRVAPGILFLSYTGSGGDEIRALRVGKSAWAWDARSEGWGTAEEVGKPNVGRGLQDPDEFLGVLRGLAHCATSARGDPTRYDAILGAKELEAMLEGLAPAEQFDLKNSKGSFAVVLGPEGRIRRVELSGHLAAHPDLKDPRASTFQGSIEFEAFERDYWLEFTLVDPATRKAEPVRLSDALADAIRALKGVPAELLGRLDKLQGK